LPPGLQEAVDSPLASVRAAAVQDLARLLGGDHAGRALAAQLALTQLTHDDSRSVAAAAAAALRAQAKPAVQAAAISPETAPAGDHRPGARPEPALPQASPPLAAAAPERSAATVPSALPGGAAAQRAARPALRRAWIAIAAAGVIVAAGGYLLAGRGGGARVGGGSGGRPANNSTHALALPQCTTKTAPLKRLPGIHTHFVSVGGQPYGVVVSPNHFGFVSLRNGAPLVVLNTSRFVPTVARKVRLTDSEGEAFTPDQRYLLVAGDHGMTVFRARSLEARPATPVASVSAPGGKGALQVVPSLDGKLVFVALQDSHDVAVFDLHQALAGRSGHAGFVGMIRMRSDPTGMAVSPGGRYLYVVSGLGSRVHSGMGTLAIVDIRRAETSLGSSVVKVDNAGCGPARVLASPDGKYVWVTSGGGNALEAFSAGKLLSDPRHALVAWVRVGQVPLGMALVSNGTRMVVADSSRGSKANGADLAVINVPQALARKPAVVGTIQAGVRPHQLVLEPDRKTLLVTNTGSGQVEAVNVAQLP
jgi:DNA-binding beta-propeller fold protein YncE